MSSDDLLTIPEDVLLGFASSAYQIEGGWDVDGRGESIWDRYVHCNPQKIADGSSGDVSADSYHHCKEDVALIKELGGQIYRFSLSWSRLLPDGFANNVNQAGLDYYNRLIDELLANNIEPMGTIFHWDLPQSLQEIGGWPNERLVDYYEDYARVVFSHFGDRVKKWVTINEPLETALFGYGIGIFAPGISRSGIAEYLAGHTILKAHARVYHMYQKEFRDKQHGLLGISLNTSWTEPKTSDPKDVLAARLHHQFTIGWFAHPIFSETGDYPPEMKSAIAKNSLAEGFPRSRLPQFDEYWVSLIRGSADFFGVNHYTSNLITHKDTSSKGPSWSNDAGTETSQDPSWPETSSFWFRVVPEGFRKSLVHIKEEYGNPLVYVTENGVSDDGRLVDDSRVSFFRKYICEMLKAIHLDGVNIKVYTAWSLMDSFEWLAGYKEKFGVISVDMDDPNRKRAFKKSAKFLKNLYSERRLRYPKL